MYIFKQSWQIPLTEFGGVQRQRIRYTYIFMNVGILSSTAYEIRYIRIQGNSKPPNMDCFVHLFYRKLKVKNDMEFRQFLYMYIFILFILGGQKESQKKGSFLISPHTSGV